MLGLAGLIAFLPSALLGAFAGVVADRYDRKVVCIAADMAVGIASAVYALLLFLFDLPLWTVFVVLLARGTAGAFQQPAYMALTPQYVPVEDLLQANGLGQTVASVSYILGPALGAALFAAFSLPVVLISDLVGAFFACSLMAVAKVPPLVRTTDETLAEPAADASEKHGLMDEIKAGIQVFRQDKPLLLMLIIQTLFLVFFVPLSSLYPLMTSNYFNLSAWFGGAVEASVAAGMFVASLVFGSVVAIKKKFLLVSYLGCVGCGITCGALLGAVAALGAKKMGRRAQETYGFNKECGDLAREFQAKLGDTNCSVLRKLHADQTNRCLKTVLAACDVLESHMAAAEQE